MIKIFLKQGKDEAVRRFHPWIFSGAIKKMSGTPEEGDIVEVFSNDNTFLACGHYQNSSIAVRILSFEQTDINRNFWKTKLEAAYNYRLRAGIAGNPHCNVYRLVHAEGDGLSGLIIDFYNGHAVIQCHAIGMYRHIETIAQVLKEIYGDALTVIYDKSGETLPRAFATQNRFLLGNPSPCIVNEYGHSFAIDYVEGQKTGFFIDQRENRQLLKQYSQNRDVLNTFCYSGGFSLFALSGGARSVHSVDSSAKAIALTDRNISLNNIPEGLHQSYVSDTLNFLKQARNAYDIIILDPPAYAKHKDVKHNAVQGYKRLNQEALECIRSGGFLFTFSCSQVVDAHLFASTVIAAAINAKRQVRILHRLTQPADHPVNAFHQEGEYLKGLVLYVE